MLETPSEDCYVARLDSSSIERAIHYCGGDYERCEIYKVWISGAVKPSKKKS